MSGFEIDPRAAGYYESTTLESAVQIAKELIDEWDYERDPHGYCHTRPVLARLVEAAQREAGS